MLHAHRMPKWIAAGAVAASLTLFTAGCGTTTTASGSSGGNANEEVGEKLATSIYCGDECQTQLALEAEPDSVDCSVGVSWSSASFPYGAKSTEQIPEFASAFFPKMKETVTDGQGDATTQSGQVDDMVAQGIDVLIVSPQDAAALAGAVERAKAAGVHIIAADRAVDAEVDTYIGSDNVEAGEVSGKAVADALGEGGKVVELAGSLGASPTIDRGNGFRSALEGSGVEIVATQTANYDRAEGLKVMEDFLQRFGAGEIDAVYTHNDQMAFGAIQAIKEAGRLDEIKVFGIDGESGALDLVKAGEYAATVGYPLVVKESVIAAAKLCAGEELEPRIVLDSTLIDADNVDDYMGRAPQ
jgi:ribose transport system substrate-binding protein